MKQEILKFIKKKINKEIALYEENEEKRKEDIKKTMVCYDFLNKFWEDHREEFATHGIAIEETGWRSLHPFETMYNQIRIEYQYLTNKEVNPSLEETSFWNGNPTTGPLTISEIADGIGVDLGRYAEKKAFENNIRTLLAREQLGRAINKIGAYWYWIPQKATGSTIVAKGSDHTEKQNKSIGGHFKHGNT